MTNPALQTKLQKADGLLMSSSYSYNLRADVRDTVSKLLTQYDTLDATLTQQPDNPMYKVFEITGTIPVTYQGGTYHIILSVILPALFPNVGPLVSFVNPDPNRFLALPKYDGKKYYTALGKTQYQLGFNKITEWSSHKDILAVVKQIIAEFSKEYPLYETTKQSPKIPTSILPQPISQPTSYTNPHLPSSNFQSNPYQQQQQQQPSTFVNTEKEKENLLANLKPKYHEQATAIAKKLQSDLNPQRENMVTLQNLYLQGIDTEAKFQKFQNDSQITVRELEDKIKMLDQLNSQNEKFALSAETIETCIEQDPPSKAMCDLLAMNRAIDDVNLFLQDTLRSNKIDLDTYLRKFKENSEREFYNKVLMNKITSGLW
jgi:hypothetical protein